VIPDDQGDARGYGYVSSSSAAGGGGGGTSSDRLVSDLYAEIGRLRRMLMTRPANVADGHGWAEFVTGTARITRELLADPVAWQVYNLAIHVIADRDAEIAQLKAQLDTGPVMLCMERDAARVMDQSRKEIPGTILRATDTGREWVLGHDGNWSLK
jgi:hypothetical protein